MVVATAGRYITRLDPERRGEHSFHNTLQTVVVIVALCALVSFAAGLLWGLSGALLSLGAVGVGLALAPRVPPEAIMKLYRGRIPDERHAGQLFHIVEALANRADLPSVPKLYVIPSKTLNAFATGRREDAAIGVTEGLLRALDVREVAAVLAHEVSHIRNRDLIVMAVADMASRMLQFMSLFALVFFAMLLPSIFAGNVRIPWLAIVVLFAAPTVANLLQLALSRVREYDADLEAVYLTGDPEALASALSKVERHTGRFWEDLLPTGRRVPFPSVLRSHPKTEKRVARLRDLLAREDFPPPRRLPRVVLREAPMVTSIGLGPIEMRPRYRLPGLWF
ncbi:MAG: zinc metalloprotease HtpX [Pseudomonadota bacterium]